MNSQLLEEKENLVNIFSQELSKVINGHAIVDFLDVSEFKPTTFTGVSKINPTQAHEDLIIPIIPIDGYTIPVPIVVKPNHYTEFLLFLRYVIAFSCYNNYTEDILNSVDAKLQPHDKPNYKIQKLPLSLSGAFR